MSEVDDLLLGDQPDEPSDDSRRPRGWLAADVKNVCDLYITGGLKIKDDKPLTPHRCALAVKELDGLDKPPSTGAVSAVFKRWKELGFATFSDEPYAFVDYTEEGRTLGLKRMQDMQRKQRADAKASRRAATRQTGG